MSNPYLSKRTFLAPALIALGLLVLGACGTEDDGGGSGGEDVCAPGERLIDGQCQPIGRDISVDQTRPDAGDDLGVDDIGGDLPPCEVGTRSCDDPSTIAICEEGGTYRYEVCAEGFVCLDGYCIDEGLTCTPGSNLGCNDEHTYRECDETGQDYDVVPCPTETPNCLADGMCTDWICVPRTTRCAPGEEAAVEVCAEDGSGWVFQNACGLGSSCEGGECLSPCEENAKLPSFLGCDYWAVDLDNIQESCFTAGDCRPGDSCMGGVCEPSAASQQFSISVSNPNESEVEVSIQNMSTSTVRPATGPAGTAQAIPLDRLDVDGTGRSRNAYHITTNLPVTAHQFNPANNVDVFSNDASLLLPSNAAGRQYVVLGWPTGPFGIVGGDEHAFGYATIIAIEEEGPTMVQVTPSVKVRAGGGINAINAGELREIVLQPGEVLSLQTEAIDGRDLSGTLIEGSLPIAVFSGHECAFVLDEEPVTLFCDHMEQQLFPVESWGTRYFGAKLAPRGTEIDVWRVVAEQPGTVLTTNPVVSGVNGRTIGPGEVLEFTTAQNFELTATAPVLLGQYMTGSNYPGIPLTCWVPATDYTGGTRSCSVDADCAIWGSDLDCVDNVCQFLATGVGDPAFMLAVPTNQYRDNYIFLTPADYREDWFTVIAPIGTELTVDGEPVVTSALTPIGDTGFAVYRQDVSSPAGGPDPAKAHTITGSNPFALQVYGYDCDVSYAYPGGLNLAPEDTE